MSKLKNAILTFGSLFMISLVVNVSRAQGTCYINGEAIPCDQLPTWFGPVMLVFGIVMLLIWLAAFIFWIKMLVHAVKNDIPNKVIWLLALLIFGLIAALIYYFAVKKSFVAPTSMQTAPVPMEPPITTPTT